MCQFSSNCKNFTPPKDKQANQSNCIVLCARNPLLQYEIPDRLVRINQPRRGNADDYAESNMEFAPIPLTDILKQDEFKAKIKKIEESETMTNFQKEEAIKQAEMEKAIQTSQEGEELDTLNIPKPNPAAKATDAFKETEFGKAQQESMENAIKDSTDNWHNLVPKRKKKA